MNSYQILATISLCLLVFSGVVSVLVLLGVPLLVAFVGVYLAGVWYMVSMQRRARECADSHLKYGNRYRDIPRKARTVQIPRTQHSLKH